MTSNQITSSLAVKTDCINTSSVHMIGCMQSMLP